jgi:hypothetical protein
MVVQSEITMGFVVRVRRYRLECFKIMGRIGCPVTPSFGVIGLADRTLSFSG